MTLQSLVMPAVVLVLLTSAALLVSRDWRWSLAILTVQYIGVFALVAVFGRPEVAIAKIMAGWIASAVLALALAGYEGGVINQTGSQPLAADTSSGRLFRLLAVGIVGLAVSSLSQPLMSWVPGLQVGQSWGVLLLIGLGLFHLGLTTHPFKVVIGLLTVLSGFEILYAAVETSALVTGLLAGVNLGLALVGAYLLAVPTMTEGE